MNHATNSFLMPNFYIFSKPQNVKIVIFEMKIICNLFILNFVKYIRRNKKKETIKGGIYFQTIN